MENDCEVIAERHRRLSRGAKRDLLASIGDTFSNTIYISRSNSSVYMTVLSGAVQQALIGKTLDWTIGARNRVAMAWRANDFAIVANGGTPALDINGAKGALPVAPGR